MEAHIGSHERATAPSSGEQRRVLWWSLAANGGFMVVEVIAGVAYGSLALLADAAHMASDVVALSVALIAQRLAERPRSDRHTFGLQRAEVLGAQVNGLILMGVAGAIVFEAFKRAGEPSEVNGGGLLVVALLGLGVNVGSAIAIRRKAGSNLNMRGAYLHMALDAVGSVGVLIAGLLVLTWDLNIADPIISIAIALLVAYSSARLLREAVHVLMEGSPSGIEPSEVQSFLLADPAVGEVHHVHVWSLASQTPALSAHIVLEGERTLHDAQEEGKRLKALLAGRFGIDHSTLELECHPCDP